MNSWLVKQSLCIEVDEAARPVNQQHLGFMLTKGTDSSTIPLKIRQEAANIPAETNHETLTRIYKG